MRENNLFVVSLLIITVIIVTISNAASWVNAENDYCYDQVGDGHFCFG